MDHVLRGRVAHSEQVATDMTHDHNHDRGGGDNNDGGDDEHELQIGRSTGVLQHTTEVLE